MAVRATDDLFPPGEFIRDELKARNWTQRDLAKILGRPAKSVNHIMSGKTSITTKTAQELAAAFETSAELWLNLESAYRLGLERRDQVDVARRARLYQKAPISEMMKRQWIRECDEVEGIERQVLDFLRIESLDEVPSLNVAARKSASYEDTTPDEFAWCFRALRIARTIETQPFESGRFLAGLERLRRLTAAREDIREVPRLLAELGVRFLIVERLPRMRLDGVTLWIDGASPVVAMSLRYDRLDWFWFTLSHELSHVKHGDGLSIDRDLVGTKRQRSEDKPEFEQRADREACEFLVPQAELRSFITRVRPLYSRKRIIQFANLHQVHPGIVVGQLQFREEMPYSHSRDMLEAVRHIIIDSAVTDGWGYLPAA
jgi:HTH-type transcriptional regulator/antitoxin HigA